ncbi:MAG: ankyrin repeat domain-containing protein [Bacteroidota bacterium]
MRKTILILGMCLLSGTMLASVKVPEVHRESKFIVAFEINSFCKAIVKGDFDLVKKMIALGEDVNQKSLGKTPAHYAARYNKPEILELLIQSGANLKKRCDQGYTVKKYAELAHAKEALSIINTAMKK